MSDGSGGVPTALSGNGRYLFADVDSFPDEEGGTNGAEADVEQSFRRIDLLTGDSQEFGGESPLMVSDDGTTWIRPTRNSAAGSIRLELIDDTGLVIATLPDLPDGGTYYNARFADASHHVIL